MSAQMRQEFAGLSPEQQAMLEALTAQTQEQARAARDPLGLAGQSPLLFGPEAAMLDLQSLGLNPPGPMPGAPAAPTANGQDPLAALNMLPQLAGRAGAIGFGGSPAPDPARQSQFMQDVTGLPAAAGSIASDVGESVRGATDPIQAYFSSPNSTAAQRIAGRAEAGAPAEAGDDRTIADLMAGLGVQLNADQGMAPVGFGPARGERPAMPGFTPSAAPDFSAAREQMDVLRSLAGEETDFSELEALVAQLEPEERTKQERRDTELGGVFEGLSAAAGRIGPDTQVGSMLMQLGLGAAAGHSEGQRENRREDDAFAERQRGYINDQLSLGELRLSSSDARRQQQISVELQGMGLEQDEATAVAAADAQNNQMQLQMALAQYDQRAAEYAQMQPEMIGSIGDDGMMYIQYVDPATGQPTIEGVNLEQEARQAAALAAGGSGDFAAGLGEVSVAQAGAMLINQWRDAGELETIFPDDFEEARQQGLESVMALSAISGTDMQERQGREQLAVETAYLLNLLLQNQELLRAGLASMVPVTGEN